MPLTRKLTQNRFFEDNSIIMNKCIVLICVCLSIFPRFSPADDDGHQPPELKELLSDYQTETKAAIQPIRERYIDKLKQLLQSELDKQDADAAAAVNRELKEMEAGSPFAGKWTSHSDGVETNEFLPGGTWSGVWNGGSHATGHWTAVNDTTVAVTRSDNVLLYYHLNGEGHLIREIGGIDFVRTGY